MGYWKRIGRISFPAILGVLVFTSAGFFEARTDTASHITYPERGTRGLRDTTSNQCWVFSHMNKSGGMTVRKMLTPWLLANGITNEVYDEVEWSSGRRFTQEFAANNTQFTYGGYTEGLRPYDARDCKWFTVFRHPVSRVVSAYFYCQSRPWDQLCATIVMDANNVDLATFAELWGNYGLRQLALSFVQAEDVYRHEVVLDSCKQQINAAETCVPAWYRQKKYLQLPREVQFGGTPLPETGTLQFLSRVQEIVSSRYAAVGILEEWETTMALFDKTLNLPGFEWVKEYQQTGRKNRNDKSTAEDRALELAWDSTELKKFLWLDILLYDHALAVHRRQVVDYGLE